MPINKSRQAIIVGAGVGGITTSLFLARNGYKVKVFEKNAFYAGRCGQIVREGHRFDMGATLMLMPSIYRMVFESLGLKMEEFLSIKKLNPVYRIFYGNTRPLDFSSNLEEMRKQLEGIEPGSSKKFDRLLNKTYPYFLDSTKALLARNFYSFFEFFTFRNLALFLRIKIHRRHYAFLRRYFKSPFLRTAFSFQNIYLGQNPFKAPALFSMIPAAECMEGALFPEGGMYGIPDKLYKLAVELGVEYFFNCEVKQIIIENKIAQGVVLADNSKRMADIIIVNADLPYAYQNLLPDKRIASRLKRKKFSCSAMVIHFALKKAYPQLAHHSIFLAADYKKSLNMIFDNKIISSEPSFYLHSPLGTDPGAAPAGCDSITAVIPAGHTDENYEQNWDELYKTARAHIIKRLNEQGLVDFEENIKFDICISPSDWQQTCNLERGSVFGSINHSILQMGYFRPHNRHDKYKNVYFAGGSTHPGNGVPLVLLSSMLTTQRILKENPVSL